MAVGKTRKKLNAKASRGSGGGGGGGDMTTAVYDPYTMIDQVTVIDVNVGTKTNCEALLGSSGAGIIPGQRYYFSTGCPTGISIMIVTGVYLTGGNKAFSPNAEAYVTALAKWIPCTYDVATNKIYAKIPVYAINLTQTGSGTVNTVDKTFVNLLGETPVITRKDDGLINFNTTTFAFVEYQIALHTNLVYVSDPSVYSPILLFQDANNLNLRMTRLTDSAAIDDVYNHTYLEFYILIAN